VVASGHQGQHGGGERGHAGRSDHSRLGVLQLRNHRRDLRMVRIAVAGIEVVAPPVDGGLRELLRVLGPKRRGLIDGRCHGAAGMYGAIGVDGYRADAVRHGSPSRGSSAVTPRALARPALRQKYFPAIWQQVAPALRHIVVVGRAPEQYNCSHYG
jgi:hypothetical protein